MYMKFMRKEHDRKDNEVQVNAMCIMSNHSHELNKIGKVEDYSKPDEEASFKLRKVF